MFWKKIHLYYKVTKSKVTATFLEKKISITEHSEALNHPRTLMGDFHKIEKCFKRLQKQLTPQNFFPPAHIAIVHLLDDVEGGYTNVEIRAFKEAALGSGAREALIPEGTKILTDEEILSREFSQHKDT